MDPNVNLAEQLRIAHRLENAWTPDRYEALRLAELILALDAWIYSGECLPTRWVQDTPLDDTR